MARKRRSGGERRDHNGRCFEPGTQNTPPGDLDRTRRRHADFFTHGGLFNFFVIQVHDIRTQDKAIVLSNYHAETGAYVIKFTCHEMKPPIWDCLFKRDNAIFMPDKRNGK